jgi:3-oxoacyl-ACP reductase-like protein
MGNCGGPSGRSGSSSIGHELADLTRHGDRVGAELDADGDVAVRRGDDDLVEVAVADDQATEPAAVELAALSGECEERRIDEELLEEVRAGVRSVREALALLKLDVLTAPERDVPDVRAELEDRVAKTGVVHGFEATSRTCK